MIYDTLPKPRRTAGERSKHDDESRETNITDTPMKLVRRISIRTEQKKRKPNDPV